MKQRFSSLDVRVIAHELHRSLVTLRLSNVYDLSSRIFLLKFAKPDHREQVIVDSGFRVHLTSFARATAATPSPFVARLRKFLRTRRVTAVKQIGTDRVLEIEFSDGAYRLFLEFYAGGNIILTDKELTILGLLRSVNEGEEHEQYRQGLKYDLSLRQNYAGVPELTRERLKEGLQKAVEKQAEEAKRPGKKIKKKPGDALRKALAVTTTEFPPILIDHALHVKGVDRTISPEEVVEKEELLMQVLDALVEAEKVIKEITSRDTATGYILAKEGKTSEEDKEAGKRNLLYEDFHAFKPAQLAEDSSIVFIEHEGFNSTVDEFFSSIEGQKLESKLQEREDHAKRKIEQARKEQAKRIDGLQQVQELNVRKAQAIEANVERVEEAIGAVNGLIAQGMDWVDIGKLIENEQKRRNPVAEMIKLPLKLHENMFTLLLSEIDGVEDEDEDVDETDSEASNSEEEAAARGTPAKTEDKRLTVDIDLALSPWANARQYYDQKRTAAVKQEKTALQSQKALKSTEQKVLADLKKGLKQEKDLLRPVRKQFWFEKFTYFVSSDGYLVLAGRDMQQSEILYRRHLRKGDVYVHADLNGAASVIIKNNPSTPDAPIPPTTLSQAGSLSVCTSTAWESKAVMSAWWVNADQVSKTAPNGEYITNGGFVINGKKNFLPPAQLLLGFAVMWQISEESKARHVRHRVGNGNEGSRPETPDLTDGETIAEESVRGDGGGGGEEESDDDDFPDVQPGGGGGEEEERDVQEEEDEDDEFPDVQNHDEEERGYRQVNPLQSAGAGGGDGSDKEEEEAEAEAEADEVEDEAEQNGVDEEAAGDAATSEKEDGADAADPPRADAAGPGLSNKERKAQLRAEQGKPVETASPPSKAHLKGKKGKQRKLAAKYARYAYQDDEDREIAMRLLGVQKPKSADAPSAASSSKTGAATAAPAKTETPEEARARRKAQHDKTQREGLAAEAQRRKEMNGEALPDDSIDDEDTDTRTPISLDCFVGTPLAGDEILEAIPVCAPWNALGRYKYKVKMQPGQQKKGKAVREIMAKWNKDAADGKKVDGKSEDTERIWPREAELLRNWKDVEVLGVIPVKQVRVMMAGGAGGAEKGKGGKGGGGKAGRGGKGSKRR